MAFAFEADLDERSNLNLSSPSQEIIESLTVTTLSTKSIVRKLLKVPCPPDLTDSLNHLQTGSPGKCLCRCQSGSKGHTGQLQKSKLGQSKADIPLTCFLVGIPLEFASCESHLPTLEPKLGRQARLGFFFSSALKIHHLYLSASRARAFCQILKAYWPIQ